MKIERLVFGNCETYFFDGVKKYTHTIKHNGYEEWREYDSRENCIHYRDSQNYEEWKYYDSVGKCVHSRDSNGAEWWSSDHPQNPKNKMIEIDEGDIHPFEFSPLVERGRKKPVIAFCVITGDCEDCLADTEHYIRDTEAKDELGELINVKCPVFCRGEIIPCEVNEDQGYAREIGGHGRGLHKWGVRYKSFSDIEEAVKCSIAVSDA